MIENRIERHLKIDIRRLAGRDDDAAENLLCFRRVMIREIHHPLTEIRIAVPKISGAGKRPTVQGRSQSAHFALIVSRNRQSIGIERETSIDVELEEADRK